MTNRSTVVARHAWEFLTEILVDCPSCAGPAIIRPLDLPLRDDEYLIELQFRARRMVCLSCGKTTDQARTGNGELAKPMMGLPLRLRAETRHGVLFAYNVEHLEYLRTYLAGSLRVEAPHPKGHTRNSSVVSRLPAWAKSAKNRDEVLKAIDRLRANAALRG